MSKIVCTTYKLHVLVFDRDGHVKVGFTTDTYTTKEAATSLGEYLKQSIMDTVEITLLTTTGIMSTEEEMEEL